jgi:endonuclease/exonuclease/phosphatase family metal-dependent hydrolase
MQITSLNCWGVNLSKKRFRALAQALLERKSQVIMLQEVVHQWQVALLDSVLNSEYKTIPSGRRFDILNRGGLYIAVRKDITVALNKFTPYKIQAPLLHPLAWTDALLQKGWQTVYLCSRYRTVVLYNTHLLGAYGIARQSEMQVLKAQWSELASEVQRDRCPAVVCGDFNVTRDALVNSFWDSHMSEVFALSPVPITVDNKDNPLRQGFVAKVSGRGNKKPNKRIDYIFFKGLDLFSSVRMFDSAHSGELYKGFLSDHFGIEVILR